MLNLTVAHYIYLTKEQRYKIHEGNDLDVVGVSIPVWTQDAKIFNEPAKEVFCKYYLSNPKKELPIKILENGYQITLPFRPNSEIKPLTNEEWRNLSLHQPKSLEKWYDQQIHEVSSKNLLDVQDGGSARLFYREHNKIKRNSTMLSIMHFVNIEDMQTLENSLFMLSEDNPSKEDQSAL